MSHKFSIKDQHKLKKILVKEFNLVEQQVSKAWLDHADVTPDHNDPTHWDYLLYNKHKNCYINFRFFPRITVEPAHTTTYDMGVINYTGDSQFLVSYLRNILNE